MFSFCSLSSGSSGNSSLLKIGKHNILIDAGLSLKKIELKLAELSCPPTDLTMLFLTHAHGDHAKSVSKLSLKYNIPVYLTRETYAALLRKEDPQLEACKKHFFTNTLHLPNLEITIFRLPHLGCRADGADDAGVNVGFAFDYSAESSYRFSYFTDLGSLPEHILPQIKDSNFYFIEANHDVGWQKASRRPAQVIQRNLSNFGHLSNEQAADILAQVAGSKTKLIMLGHISQECNSHVLAEQTIRKILAKHEMNHILIKIAPEGTASELINSKHIL